MKQINTLRISNQLFNDGWTKTDKRIINGKTEYVLLRDDRTIIVNEDIYNYIKCKDKETL
jgi:hypothetical protein